MKIIKDIFKKFKDLDQIDLEIFLAEILHKDRPFIFAHTEQKLSLWQYLKLNYFIYQRKQGFSVAAIIQHKEFYGLDFYVNKDTLIPRPDTEIMIDKAIAAIKELKPEALLIDIGTGSGCIPISILKNLPKPTQAFAIDISKKALKVARRNAKTHGLNINFLRGNLLEPVIKKIPLKIKNVIITANLPYLTEKQFQTEQSIWREPKIALVAKNNGLALYEELFKQIKLIQNNYNLIIFLEIDPSQTEAISKIIKQDFPKASFDIKKDLSGLDRLVKINLFKS